MEWRKRKPNLLKIVALLLCGWKMERNIPNKDVGFGALKMSYKCLYMYSINSWYICYLFLPDIIWITKYPALSSPILLILPSHKKYQIQKCFFLYIKFKLYLFIISFLFLGFFVGGRVHTRRHTRLISESVLRNGS